MTIKPLYGKQQGAVVGYNPHKPGRPSHAYHSYQLSGLRLMLGVDVLAGNHSHANHTLPGVLRILDGWAAHKRPKLVRGDAGLAGEPMFCALEERGQNYLFKLRLTTNVKRYIEKLFWEQGWNKAGQGWEGKEGELRLDGWSRARRVVVLRRPLRGEALLPDESQGVLSFVEANVSAKRYEYAALVTGLNHELLTIAQLYRGVQFVQKVQIVQNVLNGLERFEPRLSAPGLHLASGIFGLTAESGLNQLSTFVRPCLKLFMLPENRSASRVRKFSETRGHTHRD